MGLFERIFSINFKKIAFYCFLKVVSVKAVNFLSALLNVDLSMNVELRKLIRGRNIKDKTASFEAFLVNLMKLCVK